MTDPETVTRLYGPRVHPDPYPSYAAYRHVRALARADRALGLTESAAMLTLVADRLAITYSLGTAHV